jgi:hypothetical protein
MVKKHLIIFILISLPFWTNAQNAKTKSCKQKVGYFASRNIEKLSKKLTQNMSTDEEKVCAIHYWITHNIKYDYKRSQSKNTDVSSISKVLKSKKGMCYEYSLLLKKLCEYADIPAVIIPGYTKNIGVDICDSFYLEDHAWNAVLINNEWRLVDATWDAGYVRNYKKTIIGRFVYVFTLGKKQHYKYKPKFIFDPDETYFLKTGNTFIYNHFAANQIWQLLNTPMNIQSFEKDSNYYFLNNRDESIVDDNQFMSERMQYFSNDDTSNLMIDGIAFNTSNPRNLFKKGIAFHLRSIQKLEEVNSVSNINQQIEACKSAYELSNKAIELFDSNALFLNQQIKSQLRNIDIKNKQLIEQNKKLMKVSKNQEKYVKKNNKQIGKIYQFAKTTVNNNRNTVNNTINSSNTALIKYAKTTKTKEFETFKKQIDSLDYIIFRHKDSLNRFTNLSDRFQDDILDKLNESNNLEYQKTQSIKKTSDIRLKYGFDNFDFAIKTIRDSIIIRNDNIDSMMFFNKLFMYDSFLNYVKNSKKLYAENVKLFKQKASLLKKLKSKGGENEADWIDQEAIENINEFIEMNNQYNTWLVKNYNQIRSYKDINSSIAKHSKKSEKLAKEEKKLITPKTSVKLRNQNLTTLNKKLISNAQKVNTQSVKLKSNLEQKK